MAAMLPLLLAAAFHIGPAALGWNRHFGIAEHPQLPDLSVASGVDVF